MIVYLRNFQILLQLFQDLINFNIVADNNFFLRYRIRFWITFNIDLLFNYLFFLSFFLTLLYAFYLFNNWLFMLNWLNHFFLLGFLVRYSAMLPMNLFLHSVYFLFELIHLLFNAMYFFFNFVNLLFKFGKLITCLLLFRRSIKINLVFIDCRLHWFLKFLFKKINLFWFFILNKAILV